CLLHGEAQAQARDVLLDRVDLAERDVVVVLVAGIDGVVHAYRVRDAGQRRGDRHRNQRRPDASPLHGVSPSVQWMSLKTTPATLPGAKLDAAFSIWSVVTRP